MVKTLESTRKICSTSLLLLLLSLASYTSAIKFDLEASSSPHIKCVWNYALSDTLVVITINTLIPNGSTSTDENDQRVDVEIVDGSKHNNIYLSKKNIRQETRMAINTHSHADLGVCLKNTLRKGTLKILIFNLCYLLYSSNFMLNLSLLFFFPSGRCKFQGTSDDNRTRRRHWSRCS